MPIDLDEYREQSREMWGSVTPAWQERREWMLGQTGHVLDWIVSKADPQPGQTFLDVAGGTGDLGLRVAEEVGDDGRVIGTDFAPEMVETAKRNAEAAGAGNIEYRVLDAEKMDLADDSVDGVVCRWGYMLMADPAAALRETRRVLRDGEPLAFAVWATPDRNPWAAVPGMTMVQLGHMPPPEPGTPGMFALGDPARIRELVTQAGFADVEIEELAFEFHYTDDDDVWTLQTRLAGGIARTLAALPEDEQMAARAAILEGLAPFRGDDGTYTVPALTLGVLAR